MKKIVVSILFTIILIACSTEKTPDYVIPKDKMIDIIVDIHMTDAMMTIVEVRRDIMKTYSDSVYDQIFDNYGYNRHDFDTSVYYYSYDINKFDDIYKEVLNILSEKEAFVKQEGTVQEDKGQ